MPPLPASAMPRRVLLVEPDATVRHALQQSLTLEGPTVLVAASAGEALALLGEVSPDAVVANVRLHDVPGDTFLQMLEGWVPWLTRATVFYSLDPRHEEADRRRVADRPFLTFPILPDALREAVRSVATPSPTRPSR